MICSPPSPQDFSRKLRLEQLKKGRHPTKGFLLGKVQCYDGRAEWQTLLACVAESPPLLEGGAQDDLVVEPPWAEDDLFATEGLENVADAFSGASSGEEGSLADASG